MRAIKRAQAAGDTLPEDLGIILNVRELNSQPATVLGEALFAIGHLHLRNVEEAYLTQAYARKHFDWQLPGIDEFKRENPLESGIDETRGSMYL